MAEENIQIEKSKKGLKITIPIVIIISLLCAVIPFVMAYGSLTEKVKHLESEDQEKKETIISMEERIIVLEKIAAGTEVSLISIKDDVGEIKSDIKDIAKAVRSP